MMAFAVSKFIEALFLLSLAFVDAQYLSEPAVRWTYQLPGSGTLSDRGVRRNNAVVLSYDGSTVFVTADDGSLHIIKPENLANSIVVDAPSEQNAYTECRSGVAISETGGTVNFAVYAAILTQNASTQDSSTQATSRVIAVHVDGSVRWSIEVPGYVEGTPVLGIDGTTVYVSHNVQVSGGYQGTLSVIKDNGGSALIAAELTIENRSVPFGPLTIQYDASTGMYKDYVFWGETSKDGGVENPSLYVLLQSNVHTQNNGTGSESYLLKTFSTLERALVMKPTVSADLYGLWVGGGSSLVAGWTGDQGPASNMDASVSVSAGWEASLETPEWDPTQPLPTAIVVSTDNSAIYLTDASFNLVCIDAETGDVLWSEDSNGTSGYVVEPKLSEIDGQTGMIYTIETQQGNVRQHVADEGTLNWAFDCADITGLSDCMDSVEAEFSISSNGNVLVLADIFGKVTALEVAAFPAPAPMTSVPIPSAEPQSTPVPTVTDAASPSPTASAPETEQPSNTPNVPQPGPIPEEDNGSPSGTQANSAAENPAATQSKDQTLVFAMIAVGGVSAIVACGFFALLFRRRRKARQEDEEVHKETEAQRKRREQQRLVDEASRLRELAILEEIGALPKSGPSTPKRSNKTTNESEARTPRTLPSIDEVDNEEMSVSPSVAEEDIDGSTVGGGLSVGASLTPLSVSTTSVAVVAKSGTQNDHASDTTSFAYLPVALTASFDKVVGPLGLTGRNPGNKVATSEEQLASDRPWAHVDQRADDDSSIGSESLFLEDEGSIKSDSASAYTLKGDDLSQPGKIVSKPEEKDPWTTIMSSIIAAEQQFFNPVYGSKSTPAPATVKPSTLPPHKADSQTPPQKADPQTPPPKSDPQTPPHRADPQTPPRKADPQTPSQKADPQALPRATVNPQTHPPTMDNLHTPLRATTQFHARTQIQTDSETGTPLDSPPLIQLYPLVESDPFPRQTESLPNDLPFDEAPPPPISPILQKKTRSIVL